MSSKINLALTYSGIVRIALLVLFISVATKSYGQDAGGGKVALPVITFSPGSATLSSTAQAQLGAAGDIIANDPGLKVVTSGNPGGTKIEQQLSWDRVNKVIEWLSANKGVDRSRFIFRYEDQSAPRNSIVTRPAAQDEEGPSSVPPPHPDLAQ